MLDCLTIVAEKSGFLTNCSLMRVCKALHKKLRTRIAHIVKELTNIHANLNSDTGVNIKDIKYDTKNDMYGKNRIHSTYLLGVRFRHCGLCCNRVMLRYGDYCAIACSNHKLASIYVRDNIRYGHQFRGGSSLYARPVCLENGIYIGDKRILNTDGDVVSVDGDYFYTPVEDVIMKVVGNTIYFIPRYSKYQIRIGTISKSIISIKWIKNGLLFTCQSSDGRTTYVTIDKDDIEKLI